MTPRLRLLGLAALLLAGTGCSGGLDLLCALPLDHPPEEPDWAGAVPLERLARGGRTSGQGDGTVDSDPVHRATASCHHGTPAPPVAATLRAFYTRSRLYLRVDWTDPTRDVGPEWRWQAGAWKAGDHGEDGLGILWGPDSAAFSCTRLCHLDDWRVAGRQAAADFAMRTGAESAPRLDFWVWKAGRGRTGGYAEDGSLGPEGWQADVPGRRVVPNSVRFEEGRDGVWLAGDLPWSAPPAQPGARAPAYRATLPDEGGARLEGSGVWEGGRWRVVLSRALTGTPGEGPLFRPGGEYTFGLALLDGVEQDHNAVDAGIRLLLVPEDRVAAGRKERRGAD